MTRSKEELINELARLGAELALKEKIASISEHEGLLCALDELTSKCVDCVKCKKYKASKEQIKNLEILNNFVSYLNDQKERMDCIRANINDCKAELARYKNEV